MNDSRKKNIILKDRNQTSLRTAPVYHCESNRCRSEYWQRKFKEIELETAVAHFHRKSYIKQVLPPNVCAAVFNALYFTHDAQDSDEIHKEVIKPGKRVSRFKTALKSRGPSASQLLAAKLRPHDVWKSTNPYINFLRKSPDDANIWLPRKAPLTRVKNMTEKSEIITQNIISDFLEYVGTLGPPSVNSDIPINEKTLKGMFKISTKELAVESMCLQVKEVASVPAKIAKADNNPKKSTRIALESILEKDIKAENSKIKVSVFGTSLPKETQTFPPKNNTYDNWIKCTHVPEDLRTMECVFKGIMDTHSVKAYCEWLMQNPSFPRPIYLNEMGFLTEQYWNNMDMSYYTRDFNVSENFRTRGSMRSIGVSYSAETCI